ncbi:MAG: nicotinate-nucleotide--dimethylbenzimidazole phosphoribosyltransferase, partial [Phreatobacter sp.]|uniref:nicotinate-nucleotide--dimethylbenzimidazole phosphoribosyltransferase n=1 Tax=Phreatobacter sp. TaxID=1966341 RepID=UPI0040360A78
MVLPPPNPTGLPFEDIRDLLTRMPGPDEAAVAEVRARDAELTKPAGALGRLEDIVEWVAAWSGNGKPRVDRPLVAIFATAHGVTAQGVSAFPDAVNRQMLENFAAGGAAVNQLCIANDIGLKVFDLAIEVPTPDITTADALDEPACAATIAFGMEAIVGADLLCLGEMGIGNTTVAAAVYHGLYGGEARDWVGPGTGVDAEGLKRKADVVARAVARAGGPGLDPLEV